MACGSWCEFVAVCQLSMIVNLCGGGGCVAVGVSFCGGGLCGSGREFLWGWGVWPGVDRVAPGDQTMVSGWRKSGQSFLLPPLTAGVTDPAILTQPAFSGHRSGRKSIHYSYPAYAETRNLKQ